MTFIIIDGVPISIGGDDFGGGGGYGGGEPPTLKDWLCVIGVVVGSTVVFAGLAGLIV